MNCLILKKRGGGRATILDEQEEPAEQADESLYSEENISEVPNPEKAVMVSYESAHRSLNETG
jgi:hypothetical protein